jgi:hypothetical protein
MQYARMKYDVLENVVLAALLERSGHNSKDAKWSEISY